MLRSFREEIGSMPASRRLQARIEVHAADNYRASYRFVASNKPGAGRGRAETSHSCSSEDAARQWLQDQAADLGIEYVDVSLAVIRGPG